VVFHLSMDEPARLLRLRHFRLVGGLKRRHGPSAQEPP
jgi:hypothetical protein